MIILSPTEVYQNFCHTMRNGGATTLVEQVAKVRNPIALIHLITPLPDLLETHGNQQILTHFHQAVFGSTGSGIPVIERALHSATADYTEDLIEVAQIYCDLMGNLIQLGGEMAVATPPSSDRYPFLALFEQLERHLDRWLVTDNQRWHKNNAKHLYLAGDQGAARFELLMASSISPRDTEDMPVREIIHELAKKLDPQMTKTTWNEWYLRGKHLFEIYLQGEEARREYQEKHGNLTEAEDDARHIHIRKIKELRQAYDRLKRAENLTYIAKVVRRNLQSSYPEGVSECPQELKLFLIPLLKVLIPMELSSDKQMELSGRLELIGQEASYLPQRKKRGPTASCANAKRHIAAGLYYPAQQALVSIQIACQKQGHGADTLQSYIAATIDFLRPFTDL